MFFIAYPHKTTSAVNNQKSQTSTVYVCGEDNIKYIMLTRRAKFEGRQESRSDNERLSDVAGAYHM